MATANIFTARMRQVIETRRVQPSRSADGLISCETVAGAIQGIDSGKFGIDLAELAPQPLDMAVDGAVVDIDIVLIGRGHQLVAALDDTGPRSQRLQDQ